MARAGNSGLGSSNGGLGLLHGGAGVIQFAVFTLQCGGGSGDISLRLTLGDDSNT